MAGVSSSASFSLLPNRLMGSRFGRTAPYLQNRLPHVLVGRGAARPRRSPKVGTPRVGEGQASTLCTRVPIPRRPRELSDLSLCRRLLVLCRRWRLLPRSRPSLLETCNIQASTLCRRGWSKTRTTVEGTRLREIPLQLVAKEYLGKSSSTRSSVRHERPETSPGAALPPSSSTTPQDSVGDSAVVQSSFPLGPAAASSDGTRRQRGPTTGQLAQPPGPINAACLPQDSEPSGAYRRQYGLEGWRPEDFPPLPGFKVRW